MTRLFGVIGHPISHSLSPAMHTAALNALHMDAIYAPFEVPRRFLKPMLRGFILAGVDGLNVTVPLKEAVVPLVDRLDSTAKAIGAVNTIVIRKRRMVGYTTDGVGFKKALHELGWHPVSGHAVILGAGGAGRAVSFELSRIPGRRLTITDCDLLRAQKLARWILRIHPRAHVWVVKLDKLRLDDADMLVNATPVGMGSNDDSAIDTDLLHRKLLVYDLVYNRETVLVREARRRGCVAANGLSMLLYQGAESLHLWLDRKPPIEVMRRALKAAIG